MVEVGSKAPDFKLGTDGGGEISLKDLQGRIVVLYFYPKDDTSGCTKEAVAFSEAARQFDNIGAVVVGVSPDSATKHDKFKAKYGLDVTLAADEDKAVCETYGVWVQESMYGRKYMGVERSTFLIDRAGKVAKLWRKVKVPGHAEEVLAAAKAL
jgi:peroxiredoxin Q/BCP